MLTWSGYYWLPRERHTNPKHIHGAAASEVEVDEGARGLGGHQGQGPGEEDGVEPAVLGIVMLVEI